jgi:polyhydroxyalkanoate synthesis regulator protein
VVDAKTGEDITRQVLTQIIVDEEARGGDTLLPVNFLRQLIGMYGGQMQAAVPQYLDAAMDAFHKNQEAMREAITSKFGGANVFADLAKRNMAMFEEAAKAMTGKKAKAAETEAGPSDIDKLRAELAALQAKVDKLGK